MPEFRLGHAADLLGVSVDTLRRWADAGQLETSRTEGGQRVVEGTELARFAAAVASDPTATGATLSARNRFTGLVTRVVRDGIMAQVEIQAGPHRIVSVITREAADDMGLEPGVLAVAAMKSTNVVVELPQP